MTVITPTSQMLLDAIAPLAPTARKEIAALLKEFAETLVGWDRSLATGVEGLLDHRDGLQDRVAMLAPANNPFVRLKHYKPDECDPKENHATECLAACLSLSVPLRSAFIRQCHNGTLPVDESLISQVDVVTQEPLGNGILDLYLSVPNAYHLGIEVKVAAREDDRHRDQAIAYSDWLRKQEPPGTLMSLVKIGDPRFDFSLCGIAHRMTWRKVYDCFRAQAASIQSGTDAELARAFCGYLVNEGIVMDYDVKSLVRFADGMKAQIALEATFTQVADELVADGFETNTRMKRDQWPRLEIKGKDWSAIFGEGQNYRIYLWFQVAGIWNATTHDFWPTLEVCNQEYPSDWALIQPRLRTWLKTLGKNGLDYDVYMKNWNTCQTNLAADKITTCPVRISAYRDQPRVPEKQIMSLDPEGLVRSLVLEVREFAKIIDKLR